MSLGIKIAVIGCGAWGENLIRNFSELGALAAIHDVDIEKAQKLSLKYNAPFLSLKQIWENKDVLGVVVATPPAQHAAVAEAALKSGKHVFVEKPIALKVKDALKLCELSEEFGCHLMVGHLLQYHPAFIKLKQIVCNGMIGKIQYIYSNRLNIGKFRIEENALWSFAPHDISMILSLVADVPESIYATGACYLNPHIEDVTTTYLSFNNGIYAHVFVSWLHPFKEQKLIVVGDKGMVVFDDGQTWDKKLELFLHQVKWINGIPSSTKVDGQYLLVEAKEPLKIECQHFLNCIKNCEEPRTNGYEGLRVLQVLEAAERSLRTGVRTQIVEHNNHLWNKRILVT